MPEGKLQRNSGGKLQRNSDGKLIRNSSSSTDCCCTGCDYYRFRRCCDDVYVDFSVASTDLPQLPFTAIYTDTGAGGGDCWYVNASSTCVAAIDYPVISIDDLEEYTDCAECYPECTDCVSASSCGCCADDCTGTTPTDFTVTISGVTASTSCSSNSEVCDGASYWHKVSSGSYSGGTYTLSQISACRWESSSFSGPTVSQYEDSGCTTLAWTNATTYKVVLVCGAGAWALQIESTDTPPVDCEYSALLYRDAGISPFDCCASNSSTNELIGAFVNTDVGFLDCASGGSAVITPC